MPGRGKPMTGDMFRSLCRRLAPLLTEAEGLGLDAYATLYMLGGVESSFGAEAYKTRYEKSYDVGGRYCSPELSKRFGRDAACSYGPFQIMFVNAWAMDTLVEPDDMLDPLIAGFLSCEFLNNRLARRKPMTPLAVLDLWNTGSQGDKYLPAANYTTKGVAYYEQALNP